MPIIGCSLKEAWGDEYLKRYESDDNDDSMLKSMPNADNRVDETILKDRSITEVSKGLDDNMSKFYKMNKEEISEKVDKAGCDHYLDHILKCKECRHKLGDLLSLDNKSNVVEGFAPINHMDNMNQGYIDIFILIIAGIFLILIMDCFVRLGRNFKR